MANSHSNSNAQGKPGKPDDKGKPGDKGNPADHGPRTSNDGADDHGPKPRPLDDDGPLISGDPDEPPTLNDYVATFIARFDGNADAAVALDEMLTVLDPDAAHPGFDKHVGKLFAAMDANADGLLDVDELTTVMGQLDAQNNGKPGGISGRLHAATVQLVNLALRPDTDDDGDDAGDDSDDDIEDGNDSDSDDGATDSVTLTELVDQIMLRFDADTSDSLTLAEMLAVLDPALAHPGFDKHVGKIFAAIDASGDRLLSRDELTSAIDRLDREQEGRPEDVPGRLHAATVQLVGLALENHGQYDIEG